MQNTSGFAPSMEIEYRLRKMLISLIAPTILPLATILKTGGIKDSLRMITSLRASESAITKSAFLNGFFKLQIDGPGPYRQQTSPCSFLTLPVREVPRSI